MSRYLARIHRVLAHGTHRNAYGELVGPSWLRWSVLFVLVMFFCLVASLDVPDPLV